MDALKEATSVSEHAPARQCGPYGRMVQGEGCAQVQGGEREEASIDQRRNSVRPTKHPGEDNAIGNLVRPRHLLERRLKTIRIRTDGDEHGVVQIYFGERGDQVFHAFARMQSTEEENNPAIADRGKLCAKCTGRRECLKLREIDAERLDDRFRPQLQRRGEITFGGGGEMDRGRVIQIAPQP